MNKKKILFIINPIAGTGKSKIIENQIKLNLDTQKFDYKIAYTKYKHHANEIAQQALKEDFDIIIAAGGDGTINEVVNAIVDTSCIFGIIPVGSGNGLAYHLHIPMNIKKAINLINKEHIESIDTVSLNDYIYASIAGIGFDAYIAKKFSEQKGRGFINYFKFILKYILTYQSNIYIIEEEDRIISQKAFLVCFANSSQWGFNVRISPESSVQDGYINACFIKKPLLMSIPFLVMFLLSGNLNKIKRYVKIYKLKQFSIRTLNNEMMPVHIDGDYLSEEKVLKIKAKPLSLRILLNTNI